jgi:hypothetical protein
MAERDRQRVQRTRVVTKVQRAIYVGRAHGESLQNNSAMMRAAS